MPRRPARPAGATPRTGEHVPVLLDRVRELLAPALSDDGSAARPAVHVDATLGLGGHAEALLADHPHLRLVGIDRDPAALARAAPRLAAAGERVRLVRAEFDAVPDALAEAGADGADGVLFDLGVSSLQLDEAARGFAYAQDAPLDMRMDPDLEDSAADVVNTWEERALASLLRRYGEEPSAGRIARALVRARADDPITTTGRLADLVRDAVPAAARRRGGHPAKRTFQALRIEVNAELEILRRALPRAVEALRPGGVIVVLSYHSLEDRIVKRALAEAARGTTPEGLPVELPGHGPRLRLLTRGAEGPSEAEVQANPRATSVRLRAAQALGDDSQEDTP